MLLFRYFASHAGETLRDARLKVSRISSFNDPFECMFRDIGEITHVQAQRIIESPQGLPQILKIIQQAHPSFNEDEVWAFFKKYSPEVASSMMRDYEGIAKRSIEKGTAILDDLIRVVCFASSQAEPEHEILMWSHYSASHKGIRIGFEFPKATYPYEILEIDYHSTRVGVDLVAIALDPSSAKEALKRCIRTKNKSWVYEKEYRLFIKPNACMVSNDQKSTLEYIPLNKEWIKRVDFGARHPLVDRSDLFSILRSDYPHVECYQAHYHRTDYALTYERLS